MSSSWNDEVWETHVVFGACLVSDDAWEIAGCDSE